jgi:hypothetical protein
MARVRKTNEIWSISDLCGFKVDPRPLHRRYDGASGLSLHEAMIFYGDALEAEQVRCLELDGYDREPPTRVDESGWPNTEECLDFDRNSSRLTDLSVRLQHALMRKLESGELYATGYTANCRIDALPTVIAADRWRILKSDFVASSAASAVDQIVGILVYKRKPRTIKSPAVFSGRELRSWYIGWVAQHAGRQPPSRTDDAVEAKQRFGRPIPRDALRALRRELAPDEWKRFGRRKLRDAIG